MVTLKQRVDASLSLWQMQNMGVRKFNQGKYHVPSGNRSAADRDDSDDNCCLRCLRCLTRVPCATLCCWVFMILSVCACGGSLIIGAEKTRALLNEDKTYMHLTHWVCIGVMLGMLLMGVLFLIVAVVSSGKTSKSCFNSHNKNICGRVLNVFAVLFMLILQIAWLAATTLLFLPVALFILLHILHRVYKVDCINLKHYAITREDKEYCGSDLTMFFLRSDEAFICYAVAYCSAFLATLSMTFFIITASSNFTFLRESRHVSYEVYRNDIRRGSHDSVNMTDTKM